MVQCPKEFGGTNSVEDQGGWSDFSFAFKQWLVFADPQFEPDFKHIGDHPTTVVTFHDSPQGMASRDRGKKLFSILAGILKHRPLKVLRQVTESNGLEIWMQLNSLCMPKTKGRSLALLNAIMSFPNFSRDKSTGTGSESGKGCR